MKTDFEEKIAYKLEGFNILEEAIAEHLANNLNTLCDMQCREEWTDGRYRKCCNESTCGVLAREHEFLEKIKQYKLKNFIDRYYHLFRSDLVSNKYRLLNHKTTLEDRVFNILCDIERAKKFLSDITESDFNSFEGHFEDLWLTAFENSSKKINKRVISDAKCFPIHYCMLINMETGELYSNDWVSISKRFFYIFSFPKLELYDNYAYGLFCEVNRDTVYDSAPITPEDIKKIKRFGENDYNRILEKVKKRLNDSHYTHTTILHTNIALINIEKISYGKINVRYHYDDQNYKVAVISDKNGNNITIAHEKEIASTDNTRFPDDANYYNNDDRYHNIFFSIKPSDLIGSTLIAEFYVCKDKIYAEPISVLTDENLIHLTTT
jgi:mRNA-degrading endonuclease RelE of RelBE toxin-antitoxin system